MPAGQLVGAGPSGGAGGVGTETEVEAEAEVLGTQRETPFSSVVSCLPIGQSHFFVTAFGFPPSPQRYSRAAGARITPADRP